jgi:hypothetical protein
MGPYGQTLEAQLGQRRGVRQDLPPEGRLSILYKGIELACRTFDKIQQVDQGAIAENNRHGAALTFIREEQLRREPQRRSMKAPRRRDQRDGRLFKVG